MRHVGWSSVPACVASATLMGVLATARADVTADQAAAIVTFPYITSDTAPGIDTLIQLSNTVNAPVTARCFYERADRECHRTAFTVHLTSRQPLAWRASLGLSVFPLDQNGPQSNQGSLIPPVAADPFTGSLQCIVVDDNGTPVGVNALTGEATVEEYRASQNWLDTAAYNAIGIQSTPNAGNGDGVLILGGPSPEYSACPKTVTAPHFFDGATDPVTHASSVFTSLILSSCSENLTDLTTRDVTVQYDAFNEFEQRLETTAVMHGCEQAGPLSGIDADIPERSIFHVAVMGTLTGYTRVTAKNEEVGLLAVAVETRRGLSDATRTRTTVSNTFFQGARTTPDVILLPDFALPRCAADCNADRRVTVNELLMCVDTALAPSPLQPCPACDVDGDGRVSIPEIIQAVNNALNGCPVPFP